MNTIDGHVKQLQKALRGLSQDQGRVARMNARRRVRKAARRLLDLVDGVYPMIPKQGTERKKFDLTKLKVRLVARGWVNVIGNDVWRARAATSESGVKMRTLRDHTIWAPEWVLGGTPAEVRAAKKDHQLRKALAARALLRHNPKPVI